MTAARVATPVEVTTVTHLPPSGDVASVTVPAMLPGARFDPPTVTSTVTVDPAATTTSSPGSMVVRSWWYSNACAPVGSRTLSA